jgi:fatty aldehyde-generating acyl-ACP reductase
MIDGGYPKNLDSKAVGEGIHVIKGGIVEFHQDIDWQVVALAADMAKPQRQMFACFAEAMLLDFGGLHTNFSWGRNNISLEQMEQIGSASLRHGLRGIGLESAQVPSLAVA